jgi:hypothetical protein
VNSVPQPEHQRRQIFPVDNAFTGISSLLQGNSGRRSLCSKRHLAVLRSLEPNRAERRRFLFVVRNSVHPTQVASKFIRTSIALAFPSARISGRVTI